jgi:hypothetical protein
MEKEYWQQFATTGSVKDYLNYRMESSRDTSESDRGNTGVERSESDCTDRDGTVFHSDWRI